MQRIGYPVFNNLKNQAFYHAINQVEDKLRQSLKNYQFLLHNR